MFRILYDVDSARGYWGCADCWRQRRS